MQAYRLRRRGRERGDGVNEADISLIKYLKDAGPAIGTIGGLVGTLCAYMWNKLIKQVDSLSTEMKQLKESLPGTYANKTDTSSQINRLQDTMEKHMDTISTDVRTLHGDVKNVLVLLNQQHNRD